MLRWFIEVVVFALIARAISRLMGGVKDGLSGARTAPPEAGGVPQHGVHMERDPVCGTYVVPDRAVTITEGHTRVFFCSAKCRDQYRARPSTGSGRPEPIEGHTA